MSVLTPSDLQVKLPNMYRVRQFFPAQSIDDVDTCLREQLEQREIVDIVKRSKTIAIAVGSRGIACLAEIVACLVAFLKQYEAEIFIVPAMGSHGDATPEGQRAILERYGVSEQTMGVPVRSGLEVVQVGQTRNGDTVLFDRYAAEADLVIPINRIKPHTDFRGEIESGLCKMLAVGLGNHEGCSMLHKRGFDAFAEIIPEIAQVVLRETGVEFGIGIVENGYDQIQILEVVHKDSFLQREKDLLVKAKGLMPGILLRSPLDILIVEELGKDISGAGMDPNVVGRTTKGLLEGFSGPEAARIIVLNLSAKTKGNGLGIGLADFTLERTVEQLDFAAMNTNAVASGNPESAKVPIALKNECEAVLAAFKCIPDCNVESPRIVRIKNTLELEYIDVSEALLDEVDDSDRLQLVGHKPWV